MTVQFEDVAIEDVEPFYMPGDKVQAFGELATFEYYTENETHAALTFSSGITEVISIERVSRA